MKMTKHISKALREKADANNWPAKRARYARTYGNNVIQHVGVINR